MFLSNFYSGVYMCLKSDSLKWEQNFTFIFYVNFNIFIFEDVKLNKQKAPSFVMRVLNNSKVNKTFVGYIKAHTTTCN